MQSSTSSRSAAVTVVAWLAIVAGGLGSVVSGISLLMFIAGSYGTKNADPGEALAMIAGPPLVFVAGIGLLRRWRWARVCLAGIALALLAWQGWKIVNPAPREDRTFVDANGVRTTILGSGPTYSTPLIAVCVAVLAVLLSAKTQAAAPVEKHESAAQWRVGHTGRDQMYYEELRGGVWQRIAIDGEMLLGRAHHVIYFASEETWLRYPEWARHRRDEIIARIKSQFREPDYEYTDGGTASEIVANSAPQIVTPATPREMLGFLALMLGFGGFMVWLAVTGLQNDVTYWPKKRATEDRRVWRDKEPAMFWTSIGIYSALGVGCLGFSVRIIRSFRK